MVEHLLNKHTVWGSVPGTKTVEAAAATATKTKTIDSPCPSSRQCQHVDPQVTYFILISRTEASKASQTCKQEIVL